MCTICKSKNHPTSDCPVKRSRRIQDQLGQPALMPPEEDSEMAGESRRVYDDIDPQYGNGEDNPDEELHRLI